MIRKCRTLSSVAVLTIAGLLTLGMDPLFANGRHHDDATNKSVWTLQILDGRGNALPIPLSKSSQQTSIPRPTAIDPGSLQKMRQELMAAKFGLDSSEARKAEHALKVLDIVTAPNSEERHARVLSLGVSVSEQLATDGRNGTVRIFAAGGKPRVRLFVPARQVVVDRVFVEAAGGPSVREQTGRWKIGASCYWDPSDSGPDQCSPNAGRWKTGGDGCYFDSNDSGPDQCEPAQTGNGTGDTAGYTCYFEGGPSDCATEQQYDDFLATLAAGQAQQDVDESDYDALHAECVGNEDCLEAAENPQGGPSGMETPPRCLGEAAATVSALAWKAGAIVDGVALAAGPVAEVSAAAIASWGFGFVAAAAATVGAIIILDKCVNRRGNNEVSIVGHSFDIRNWVPSRTMRKDWLLYQSDVRLSARG